MKCKPRQSDFARAAGSASTVMIAVLAAAVLIFAAWVLTRDRGGAAPATTPQATPDAASPQPPTTSSATADDAAMDELEVIRDKLASAMEHKRDVTPLMTEIADVIERHPESTAARTMQAQMLMHAGRLLDAYQAFEASLAIDDEQPVVRRFAGSLAEQLNNPAAAEAHYRAAIRLDPADVSSNLALANLLTRLQRYDDALVSATRAAALDSSRHAPHAIMSDIYFKQNKLAQSHDQIVRALTIVGDEDLQARVVYTVKRAKILRRDNRWKDAIVILRSLPLEQRFEMLVSQELALNYQMMGEPALAGLHYEQALTLDPTHGDAAAASTHWYIQAKQTEDAQRMLATLRKINPRHPALERLDPAVRALEASK